MKKIILYTLAILFLLFSETGHSHQPNQLTYTFKLDKDVSTLTIHFTPKTLIDILESVKPELKGASSINLNGHKDDFLRYFSERILLNKANLEGRLSIGEMNLLAHNAFITFILADSIDAPCGLEIEVNSLTDVYSKLENFVFVRHQGETARFVLSNEQRVANWKPSKFDNEKQLGFLGIASSWKVFALSITFLGLAMLFFQKKRVKRKVGATQIKGSADKL
ncbi:MAG: hypothetical protein AAGA43_03875 [Bacteroidota bacterium]